MVHSYFDTVLDLGDNHFAKYVNSFIPSTNDLFLFTAWFFGDPHFTTLDGSMYTFNGHGEYVLMQLTDMDFEIQCRLSRAQRRDGSLSDATIFSAFVVKGNETWVQVRTCIDDDA